MNVEASPVGSSASNGVIERAIASVGGQVRVGRSALEDRWGVKLDSKHPVFTWMAEYAAVLLNRFEVGRDGKTAFERCKGKKSKTLGLEFGEGLLWKRKPSGGALGKLSCLWEDGIYLGVKSTTGEIIIGNNEGIWKARTVQRKPVEHRWIPENSKMQLGVPWKTSDDDPKADGEKLEGRVLEEFEQEIIKEVFREPMNVPKAYRLGPRDFQAHGYTLGCPGCRALLRGTTLQKHSDACRKRFGEAMAGDERIEKAKTRKNDFLDQALSKEEGERAKRLKKTEGTDAEMDEGGRAAGTADVAQASGMTDEERKASMSESQKRAQKGDDDMEVMNVSTNQEDDEHYGERSAPDKNFEKNSAHDKNFEKNSGRDKNFEKNSGQDKNSEKNSGHDKNFVKSGAPDEDFDEWAIDDLTGRFISRKMVDDARAEEITFIKKIEVYDVVDVEECWEETGEGPISTKFVDINKGSEETPIIGSRLAARHFKKKGEKDRHDLFAATLPLEAKRLLIRMAKVKEKGPDARGRGPLKLMFIDVKKAHLNAKLKQGERAYIELPPEAGAAPGKCGRLKRWLYGMRPAASAWEEDYASKLLGAGFKRGLAAPTAFYCERSGVRLVVHGDDFTFLGYAADLKEIELMMGTWYEIKVRAVLGPGENDDKEITILNRTVRWKEDCIEYEADPKHCKRICESAGLDEGSKGLDWPIVKDDVNDEDGEEEVRLSKAEATEFRGVAATANFLSQDRADVQFTAKEICRDMAGPTQKSQAKVKRLARYLLKYPRVVWRYYDASEEEVQSVVGWTDSDWAGCRGARKSASGGVVAVGGGTLKTWSSTQGTIALSSGESEYYALVKTAAECFGVQALAKDLGWSWEVIIWIDSSAAKSMASRVGLGRVRHLECRMP